MKVTFGRCIWRRILRGFDDWWLWRILLSLSKIDDYDDGMSIEQLASWVSPLGRCRFLRGAEMCFIIISIIIFIIFTNFIMIIFIFTIIFTSGRCRWRSRVLRGAEKYFRSREELQQARCNSARDLDFIIVTSIKAKVLLGCMEAFEAVCRSLWYLWCFMHLWCRCYHYHIYHYHRHTYHSYHLSQPLFIKYLPKAKKHSYMTDETQHRA